MPIRNRHRVGRYLIVDDESGITYYDDEVTTRWDGAVVAKHNNETRNPQEFVRAKDDPVALTLIRPDDKVVVTSLGVPSFVGETTIVTEPGPSTHLFRPVVGGELVFGISEMIIEGSGASGFVVG